jgi:hypothetical protein
VLVQRIQLTSERCADAVLLVCRRLPACPPACLRVRSCSEILCCVFDAYSGQTDQLGIARWSHMLGEIGILAGHGSKQRPVLYTSDGADVAATPLGEQEAVDIFDHFSCEEDRAGDARVLRADDESFADALDAVAQRRYPLAARVADAGGAAFELLLREVEEHVIAMQPN